MTALKRGFWLAIFGPLLALPILRQRLWDRPSESQHNTEAGK